MLDILCLISDGPSPNGDIQTKKNYKHIHFLSKQIIPGKKIDYMFTCNTPKKNPTKKDCLPYKQELFDRIEHEHPKIVMAFGLSAYQTLELEETSVVKICNIIQTSPLFGGKIFDRANMRYKKANPLTFNPRGILREKTKEEILLTSHKDILVYPTYKYSSLISYAGGYRGQALFERQLARIGEILDNQEPFKFYDYNFYYQHIKLFYKKEHIQEAIEFLTYYSNQKVICFDIETAGYNVPLDAQLNFRHPHAEIVMIAIGDAEKTCVFNTHHLPELIPYIKLVLESNALKLTWNGVFDFEWTMALWGVKYVEYKHIDGLCANYLTDLQVGDLSKGTRTLKFSTASMLPYGAYYAGYNKNFGIDVAIKEGDAKYLEEHEIEYMLYCGIDVHVTDKLVKLMWNNLKKRKNTSFKILP